jgi:hypothetical protein
VTFKEMKRILKPGGTLLYFHEPVCRGYIYPLALARARSRRPDDTTEDVLVHRKILQIARQEGLEGKMHFAPSLAERSPLAALYFMGLRKLPFLQHLLPCSADFEFRNPIAT